MFIIHKDYLCYYMTLSCMLGLLSSGAKERLVNYKVCKSYHCWIHVPLQGKLIREFCWSSLVPAVPGYFLALTVFLIQEFIKHSS